MYAALPHRPDKQAAARGTDTFEQLYKTRVQATFIAYLKPQTLQACIIQSSNHWLLFSSYTAQALLYVSQSNVPVLA